MRLAWICLLLACAAPQRPAEPGAALAASPATAASAARDQLADVWHWHCCNGRYTGGLALAQAGGQLRGIFLADQGMGTYVDGNIDGRHVVFTRRWLNAGRLYSQIYTTTLSEDGQRLEGTFIETHAPGPAIDFSAERRFQPDLHDFNPAPASVDTDLPPQPERSATSVTGQLGTLDAQGRFLPPDCDCARPCGCSGIPALMECHSACGCPACPPNIP